MLFFACLCMASNIYNLTLTNLSHIHNVDFFVMNMNLWRFVCILVSWIVVIWFLFFIFVLFLAFLLSCANKSNLIKCIILLFLTVTLSHKVILKIGLGKTLFLTLFTQSFFPGLFFYVYLDSPNPNHSRKPHTTGPKPYQLKTPTPKSQSKPPTPKPWPQNHHNGAKMRKKSINNKPGKEI